MTVTTDTKVKPSVGTGSGPRSGDGDGPDNQKPDGQDWPPGFNREDAIEPSKYKILMWLLIGSVSILFLAMTSAYIWRLGHDPQVYPLVIPTALWVTTGLIILSSVSFEMARRALRKNGFAPFRNWIIATTGFGISFLVGQVIAWRQLAAQGVYLQSNPHSSFFYVLTGMHAVHLLGGIIALVYVTVAALRMRISARNRNTVEVTSLYWHFMDGLWLYLFALLFFF